MNLLEKHICNAMKSFEFCPESFVDNQGRVWERSKEAIIDNEEVWHCYICNDVDFGINVTYHIKAPISCTGYFDGGPDDGEEFFDKTDLGFEYLTPEVLCRLVDDIIREKLDYLTS